MQDSSSRTFIFALFLSSSASQTKDTELTPRADESGKWPLELSICMTF